MRNTKRAAEVRDPVPGQAPAHAQLMARLSQEARAKLEDAAWGYLDVTRYFARRSSNVVAAVLRGHRPREWQHYPARDAHDADSGFCYFYHCHPTDPAEVGEHGHFHVFVRDAEQAPRAHLVSLSVDSRGFPLRASATNRWVTGETLRPASELSAALLRVGRLATGRARRNVDRWLAVVLQLFSPQIDWLLQRRDARIAALHDREHGLEDRRIQVWSTCPLSVADQIAGLSR